MGDVCLPTSKAPELGLEYIRLFREAKFQEGLYQLYSKLAEIARVDMVRDVETIRVLDPGLPPERCSNRRLLPAMLAGVLIFFTMILGTIGLEHIQNLKKREEDVQRLLLLKDYLRPWKDMLVEIQNKFYRKRKL